MTMSWSRTLTASVLAINRPRSGSGLVTFTTYSKSWTVRERRCLVPAPGPMAWSEVSTLLISTTPGVERVGEMVPYVIRCTVSPGHEEPDV